MSQPPQTALNKYISHQRKNTSIYLSVWYSILLCIFSISLKCLILYKGSSMTCALSIGHVSAPYRRADKTTALYTWNFTRVDAWWLAHNLSLSLPLAKLAFSIKKVISLYNLASSDIVIPRYTKFLDCTRPSLCILISTGGCII